MTLELLISTMHKSDLSLPEKMNIRSDAVVVNQCDKDEKPFTFTCNGHRVLWINTTERGLSRSRNMALRHASADILMLADDDMIYRDDYPETVMSAFERTDADIIGFKIRGIEKEFKKYPDTEQKVSYLRSMKMASVEIAFKRESFEKNKIAFDELIGAGTEFLMGEENALLFQCLRKKLRIQYVPQEIADLHIGESTWFNGHDEKYFIGKGASFTAMKTPFTDILILQFAVRKRSLFKKEVSVFKAIGMMRKGKKAYLKKRRQNNDT